MDEVMTARQVAEYLHLNLDIVRRKAREGILPCYKIGNGRFRFYKSEIDEWLKRQRYTPKRR